MSALRAAFVGRRLAALECVDLQHMLDLTVDHMGVIAALDAPRLSSIKVEYDDADDSYQAVVALVCSRPQPVDSTGGLVQLAVWFHGLSDEADAQGRRALRAAGLAAERVLLNGE